MKDPSCRESASGSARTQQHRHDHHRCNPGVTMVMVGSSQAVRLLHPRRDIALAVQYSPDIDVVWMLDVKHDVRVAVQRPGAQAWQVELVGVTRRARGRVAPYVGIGLLQRIDEAERNSLAGFVQVVGNSLVNIPVGLLMRDDCLGPHP